MVTTSTTNPKLSSLFNNIGTKHKMSLQEMIEDQKNKGYSTAKSYKSKAESKSKKQLERERAAKKKALNEAYKKNKEAKSKSGQSGSSSSETSNGSGITTLDDAAYDSSGISDYSSGGSSDSSDGSTSSGTTSPLLEGTMTFEELIGEICNGIDLIFATKKSTVVVTDYSSIYAEAKYLRDNNKQAIAGEDISLWQLEEGTYELDVSEYGYYNTVRVHYKNGVVEESYEDLVNVFGNVTIDYYEKNIDKTTAIMKAKAYLAAHVRDFDMSIKANILTDGGIDVGDIVTLENPSTMRDKNRVEVEGRDPEYYFVSGYSMSWEGEQPITSSLELSYGATSPEQKEVPEVGASYSSSTSQESSSNDIQSAVQEVVDACKDISYSGKCQTYACARKYRVADCYGLSDALACELKQRGVKARIIQYHSDHSQSGTHRTVQYVDESGKWQDFPYEYMKSGFGLNQYKNHFKTIKCTCD